jgi:hypothetical protein
VEVPGLILNPEFGSLLILFRSPGFESQSKEGYPVSFYGGRSLLLCPEHGCRDGSYLCFGTCSQEML